MMQTLMEAIRLHLMERIRKAQLRLSLLTTEQTILRLQLRGWIPSRSRTPRQVRMLRATRKVLRQQLRLNRLQMLLAKMD